MKVNRRAFLHQTAIGTAGLTLSVPSSRSAGSSGPANPIAFFEKTLQPLTPGEMADTLADIGFHGVEATIRKGGRIEPETASEDLPGYVETLAQRNLRILVMATSINRADQPHAEATLRTAAGLGIKLYRLAGLRYDLKKSIRPQLDALRPQLRDLAALNRELGLTAVYQNHAGSSNVGGPIWDLDQLMRDLDPEEIAVAYDIRHAMVEGSSAWPVSFKMIRPRIRAVYVKDFVFDNGKAKNVPMGDGHVGGKFYEMLRSSGYIGPISIHTPHIRIRSRGDALAAKAAIRRDFEHLRKQLDG